MSVADLFTCFLFMSNVWATKNAKKLQISESTTGNFMLSILCLESWKESINFEWMQHTVWWKLCKWIFHWFSIFLYNFSAGMSVASFEWSGSVDDEKSATASLVEECQTARNYQRQKRFRWAINGNFSRACRQNMLQFNEWHKWKPASA